MSLRRFRADKIKYAVKASTTIAKDDLVAIDATGYAIPATDTAGLKFVGVCAKGVTNAGANGAKEVEVHRTGVLSMAATSIAVTQVGAAMYVVNKTTIDESSSNAIQVGILVKYISNTAGWVYFGPGGISRPHAADGGKTTSREENVAGLSSAITLAIEAQADMASHFANATRHTVGQQVSTAFTAVAPVDLASVIVVTNLLQIAYAAHNADAVLGSGWAYHAAQLAASAMANATPVTTLQAVLAKLNDLKAKYNAHEAISTNPGHTTGTVAGDEVAAANVAYGAAIKVLDSRVQADDVIYWAILNDGTGNVTGVSAVTGNGYITFTFSGDPQNDSIISYQAIRL